MVNDKAAVFLQVVLCRSVHKQFYFRFIGRNGEELMRSSETYASKQGAEKALKAVMKIFGCTSVIVNDSTANESKCIHSS